MFSSLCFCMRTPDSSSSAEVYSLSCVCVENKWSAFYYGVRFPITFSRNYSNYSLRNYSRKINIRFELKNHYLHMPTYQKSHCNERTNWTPGRSGAAPIEKLFARPHAESGSREASCKVFWYGCLVAIPFLAHQLAREARSRRFDAAVEYHRSERRFDKIIATGHFSFFVVCS